MLFDQKFLEGVDRNPVGSIVSTAEGTISLIREKGQGWDSQDLAALMETAALIAEIISNHQLPTENVLPEMSGNFEYTCNQLFQYIDNVRGEFQGRAFEIQFASMKDRYKAALSSTFAYEFSQGDLERVQTLISELREKIKTIASLDDAHRLRLLARLEKLQSELHKRVSDLDKFWGMVGDAGVVLGKLGKDAKPIVDRIREIADIVWRTQARAEELPSGTKPPLLENADESSTT